MTYEPQPGSINLRIPDPWRNDWGDLMEAHIEVFCWLALRQLHGDEQKRPRTPKEIGKHLGLHESTVVQALIELWNCGFIEIDEAELRRNLAGTNTGARPAAGSSPGGSQP
jgi:hypothetical protein